MISSLENIAKFYGSRLIFKDVSLTLNEGELLIICGANGAGKSTLLKIMAGLERPSAGNVNIISPGNRHIGYLGHQTFLYNALSAMENLLFWAELYSLKKCRQEIMAILERVELTPFAEAKAGSFSRGMAQRLNLARILLLEPVLVLLDEPATGLDAKSKNMLTIEVAKLQQSGAAIAWISHDLEHDLAKADKLLALKDGKVEYSGHVAGYYEAIAAPGAVHV